MGLESLSPQESMASLDLGVSSPRTVLPRASFSSWLSVALSIA